MTEQTRIIPVNIEAEQALLGAIFVNNDAFMAANRTLEQTHFYESIHQRIYEVIGQVVASGSEANPITIKNYLPTTLIGLGKGGSDVPVLHYMLDLAANAMPPKAVPDLARAIHSQWVARQAIAAFDEAINTYYNLEPGQSPLKAFEPIEERMANIRSEADKVAPRASIGESYINSLQAAFQRGQIDGVPICLDEIANVLSEPCFERGNLYGLLSSSGEGKTSLTVQLVSHALRMGHPVQVLSYDQSSDQILRQMISQELKIEARRQRDAQLLSEMEFSDCMKFARQIERCPFEIYKCTDQNAHQLVGLAKSFIKRKANGQAPLIVVDHIGVVKADDQRADEGTKAKGIGQILKGGAEVTGAAWLVLNQRNSFGMKRDNPRPISMDLFGGDPAKTPFDAIFYLYRFVKFLEERKAIASSDSDWKKIDKIFPAAVREGQDIAEIGAIKVRFGSPHIREQLEFEARFTKYRSLRPRVEQERLDI